MQTILEYPNYSVTRCGRVWSHTSNKYLKAATCPEGYKRVALSKGDGKFTSPLVHRLVALQYIPNVDNLETINHIDEDKSNNDVSNLEWMTRNDNNVYSKARTFTFMYKGAPVVFHNLNAFCREHGLSPGNLHNVYTGKAKSHKGYTLA